jgi:hypothetical protein
MSAVDDRYDTMSFSQMWKSFSSTVSTGFKAAASQMLFPGKPGWSEVYSKANYPIDYAAKVGDGRSNSMVMASVLWAAKNFTEAPLSIEQIKGNGKDRSNTPVPDHPLIKLFSRPNKYYSGALLWKATIIDWMFGNAYWRKLRNAQGTPVELWWIPSTLICPKWDGGDFITYYEYKYDSTKEPEKIAPEDIVHFRNGLDPKNTRLGLSPLGALLREIYTDDEGANYTAALLSNLGVPGLVISPASDNGRIAPEDVDQIKAAAETKWTGGNRGKAMVLKLRDVRTIPEERVTAMVGIPAIVVGLGAGLQRSTFANMAEAREAAYENFMIPSQRELSEEMSTQLLIDFVSDPQNWRLFFDLAQVRVLQADENDLHNRARTDLSGGLITLDEARDLIGMAPLEKDLGDLFYLPGTVTPTPPDQLWTETQPVPAALVPGSNPSPGQEQNPSQPSSTDGNLPDNAPPPGGVPPDATPQPAKALAAVGANGHVAEPANGAYRFLV